MTSKQIKTVYWKLLKLRTTYRKLSMREFVASKDTHEVQTLKWKVKTLAKQTGRQGDTIHRLRAELAEVRDLSSKTERGDLRRLERTVIEQAKKIDRLKEKEVDRLEEKLKAIESSALIKESTSEPCV